MLVERARKGDQQSMYRLYKMYVRAMYNVAFFIVVNKNICTFGLLFIIHPSERTFCTSGNS